jgi:NAD(P)-dependent dehydrogenase (short-subunit alcohol dehydrogenase family)
MTTGGFAGERVLVTGASRGIGLAVAQAFAEAGAALTILAEDDAVGGAADGIAAAIGRPVSALRCDITDRAAVARSFASVERLDVLVNNAGLERMTPLLDDDPDAEAIFRRIVDINVLGTYYVTREAVRRMDRGGRIVFTASVWGKTAEGGFSAYCATKHANIGFMRALARELGPRGIAVNAVCPGWVKTGASLRSLRDEARSLGTSEDALALTMLSRQAFGGLMEPTDVADAYLFLASREASRNITGQTLHVDRGEFMD